MARHWEPLRDEQVRESRSRNVIRRHIGTASSQWGQRPLFSEPGDDQPPPEEGRMGPEATPDSIHPLDGRESSHAVASEAVVNQVGPVTIPVSTFNVASPPTDAQLTTAFGNPPQGSIQMVIDGGSGAVWLVIKAEGGSWWYEALTEAV